MIVLNDEQKKELTKELRERTGYGMMDCKQVWLDAIKGKYGDEAEKYI